MKYTEVQMILFAIDYALVVLEHRNAGTIPPRATTEFEKWKKDNL